MGNNRIDQAQIINWDADWGRRFPKRFTGRQKEAFRAELVRLLQERQYETEVITAPYGRRNKILMTTCAQPQVIFFAHYDTPTMMPIWASAIFALMGHTRQVTATILMLLLLYLPTILIENLQIDSPIFMGLTAIYYFLFVVTTAVMLIPNPHNREDNTSGVVALMALADWLQDKAELRPLVQFVFMDNEEWGLLGAKGLKRWWQKQGYAFESAAIINLDCVSRGNIAMLAYHHNDRVAQEVAPFLKKQFPNLLEIDMKGVPLSDNYVFRGQGAVDISFVDRSWLPGGYYIPRIHTPSDKEIVPARMALMLAGVVDFLATVENPAAESDLAATSPAST